MQAIFGPYCSGGWKIKFCSVIHADLSVDVYDNQSCSPASCDTDSAAPDSVGAYRIIGARRVYVITQAVESFPDLTWHSRINVHFPGAPGTVYPVLPYTTNQVQFASTARRLRIQQEILLDVFNCGLGIAFHEVSAVGAS